MTVKALSRIRLISPLTHQNLSAFPLVDDNPKEADYILMSDAIQQGLLAIREVSESGEVNTLKAINQASCPVLLPDSEELVGAKQNRVLNVSILLPAESTTLIPVSCVEAGRWSYRHQDQATIRRNVDESQFLSSSFMLHREARQKKSEQVAFYRAHFDLPRSNQSEVWEDIDSLSARSGTRSSTRAMRDVYEQRRDHWSQYCDHITTVPNQVGAIFAVDGRAVGAELYDAPSTFSKMFPKIVRSYAISASLKHDRLSREPMMEDARLLLSRLMETPMEIFKSVGIGEEAHWRDPLLSGCALLRDGEMVHLYAFSRN